MGKMVTAFKPGVKKHVLLMLAGLMWVGVGILLLGFSLSWLHPLPVKSLTFFMGMGIFAALIISRFGFLKIVDKNMRRILPMEGKRCVFAFMSWKSYILVTIMIFLGGWIRHSSIPRMYLSTLYTGIGLALILSSIRYWKTAFRLVHQER